MEKKGKVLHSWRLYRVCCRTPASVGIVLVELISDEDGSLEILGSGFNWRSSAFRVEGLESRVEGCMSPLGGGAGMRVRVRGSRSRR